MTSWSLQCGDVALPDEFKFCRQRRVYCHNADPAMDVEVNDSYCADKPRPQCMLAVKYGGKSAGWFDKGFIRTCSILLSMSLLKIIDTSLSI